MDAPWDACSRLPSLAKTNRQWADKGKSGADSPQNAQVTLVLISTGRKEPMDHSTAGGALESSVVDLKVVFAVLRVAVYGRDQNDGPTIGEYPTAADLASKNAVYWQRRGTGDQFARENHILVEERPRSTVGVRHLGRHPLGLRLIGHPSNDPTRHCVHGPVTRLRYMRQGSCPTW